jgi:hypothetical protein
MRRYDKKIHMKKVNLLFEQRYLNETISASDAHTDWGAMMSVLKGDRNVAFLLGPFIEKWFNKYIKDNSSVDLMVVKRDGNGIYGDAYILYSDLEKAKHLHSITSKHGGYLADYSPEEAIENGEALEYNDNDIKTFVDDHYGFEAYDKVKNNEKTR